MHIDRGATRVNQIHARSFTICVCGKGGTPRSGKFSHRAQVATIQSAGVGVRDYILVRAGLAPKIDSLAPLPPAKMYAHLHALEWAAGPTPFLCTSSPQQRSNSTSMLPSLVCGRPGQAPRHGKFGVRASLKRERQAVVLRGTTVQLNSGSPHQKLVDLCAHT